MSIFRIQRRRVQSSLQAFLGFMALFIANVAAGGSLVETTVSDAVSYRGVQYVTHSGRFVGETASGEFRVPYEIIAPVNPASGNRIVVFEPPHFLYGANARDNTLGPELLFERRFSHASVGFSNNGANLLDVGAEDAVIAGQSVEANIWPIVRDVEILKQFVEALSSDAYAVTALGEIRHRYAYGVSQSAEAIFELHYSTGIAGLFDLTVLHVPLWRPVFAEPAVLERLPDTFSALPDVGKVMLISSEGDQLITRSTPFRNAVTGPGADENYRLYEVTGAPHLPLDLVLPDGTQLNGLDVAPVVRAAFVAGNRWVRYNRRPPRNQLLDAAPNGEIDPIYWMETGIARDADGNARGGVQFPDVANGRALHIASVPGVEIVPGLPGLVGAWFDLACAPRPGGDTGPRFAGRRQYLRSVIRQILRLRFSGYILRADARELIEAARDSGIGSDSYCDTPG